MRILVALDGSPFSETATGLLIEQMKTTDTEVRLLHAVDPFPLKLAEAKGTRAYPDVAAARLEQRTLATRLLEGAAARLRSAGFTVTWTIQEGDARTAAPETTVFDLLASMQKRRASVAVVAGRAAVAADGSGRHADVRGVVSMADVAEVLAEGMELFGE